jgi:hypothetical protein
MNKLEIETKLHAHGARFNSWGKGNSKTLDHLLSEIEKGESQLIEKEGRLVRKEEGIGMNIFYHANGRILQLFTEEVIFSDGTRESREIPFSLGEKKQSEETPRQTAKRALLEELGIDYPIVLIEKMEFNKIHHGLVPSTTYPGLFTERIIHVTQMEMPQEYFKSEGYAEAQLDKTTIFKWHEVSM